MASVTICSEFGAPKNIKSVTVSTVSPSICYEVMEPDTITMHPVPSYVILNTFKLSNSYRRLVVILLDSEDIDHFLLPQNLLLELFVVH